MKERINIVISISLQICLQYDNNVSYGVVNVISTPSTDDFTCETNLSYDIVKKSNCSTVSQFSPNPLYESVHQNHNRPFVSITVFFYLGLSYLYRNNNLFFLLYAKLLQDYLSINIICIYEVCMLTIMRVTIG